MGIIGGALSITKKKTRTSPPDVVRGATAMGTGEVPV